MSLELLVLADPDDEDEADPGRTVEVRVTARRRPEEDPLEDSRLFAAGDREEIVRHIAGLLERRRDALGDARMSCRRCEKVGDPEAEDEARRPFVCRDCQREAAEGATDPASGEGDGVEVRFLGTGDAFGSGGKRNAAVFLRVRGQRLGILLDAGPGCAGGLRAEGLSPSDVAAVLLSHFHGDHFGGVPFLELDGLRTGRSEPLLVIAPPGARDRLPALRECLYPGFTPPSPTRIVEVLPGEGVRLPESAGGGSAVAFAADHQPGGWALSWTLRLGGRRIVASGDSGLTSRMIREAAGADLLIHECTDVDPLPGHTALRDLEEAAPRLRAKRVLLVHTGEAVMETPDPVFDLAHDGLRVIV